MIWRTLLMLGWLASRQKLGAIATPFEKAAAYLDAHPHLAWRELTRGRLRVWNSQANVTISSGARAVSAPAPPLEPAVWLEIIKDLNGATCVMHCRGPFWFFLTLILVMTLSVFLSCAAWLFPHAGSGWMDRAAALTVVAGFGALFGGLLGRWLLLCRRDCKLLQTVFSELAELT